MLPSRYWLTAGEGESDISRILSYDAVLKSAGIGFQNIVPVSSVPPAIETKVEINKGRGITYVYIDDKNKKIIPPSTILHVVQAINYGVKGENITACVALAKVYYREINTETFECLLAYEQIGDKEENTVADAIKGLKALIEQKEAKMDENWGNEGIKVICSTLKVKKKYGCVGAFVVFDPFSYQAILS